MGSTPTPTITRTNGGFELRTGNDLLYHVAWSDVERITDLPASEQDWEHAVIPPAFAENRRVIFPRGSGAGHRYPSETIAR